MPELKVGDMAPDFTLPSTIGDKVTLSDFRANKNVVLLFYPLDDGKILEIVKSDVPVARDIAALLEKARAA